MKFFANPRSFQKMGWLRFIERINVNGGYGDSLANPHFGDILEYLNNIAPYSRFSMTTNGIGLNPKNIETIIKYLSCIIISINSYDSKSWEYIMQRNNQHFNDIVSNVKFLCSSKGEQLEVALSMVLIKDNIQYIGRFLNLAKSIGVDTCILVHYHPMSFYGKKILPASQSLYMMKDDADKAIRNAENIASDYGIKLHHPEYFDKKHFTREYCWQPFNQCLLAHYATKSYNNDVYPCCTAYQLGIEWTYDKLDEVFFMGKIWNNAVFRLMRRWQYDKTIKNDYCKICLKHDIFNPDHSKYFIAANNSMQNFAHKLAKDNPRHLPLSE